MVQLRARGVRWKPGLHNSFQKWGQITSAHILPETSFFGNGFQASNLKVYNVLRIFMSKCLGVGSLLTLRLSCKISWGEARGARYGYDGR